MTMQVGLLSAVAVPLSYEKSPNKKQFKMDHHQETTEPQPQPARRWSPPESERGRRYILASPGRRPVAVDR